MTAAHDSLGDVSSVATMDQMGTCDIAIARLPDGTVALLTGDLETSSAWNVEQALDAALRERPAAVEVSLEGLSFMDSSGLRMLLQLQRSAQRLGVPLRF